MFKASVFIAIVSSLALAQSQTSTSNPLIPTNISPTCSKFLSGLNSDTKLSSCTASLLAATKQFGPGGNATSASKTDILNAVNTICSPSTSDACPESLIRGKLAEFYTECSTELTTNVNSGVRNIYDVLYTMEPLKDAVCSKNDNDVYCLFQSKNSSASPTGLRSAVSVQDSSLTGLLNSLVQQPSLERRAPTEAVTPNMTAFRDSCLPFLFLKPDLDASDLCTSCTRQIFLSYTNFQLSVPYAPGLTKDSLLGCQLDLYNGIQNTCGANFLQTNIQAAGGISGGTLFSAAPQNINAGEFKQVLAAVLSMMTLAVTVL
ncbi:hypothetical protein AMATHDRAFT_64531 [Amanita thiersii Skay4041]|uniref:DUF7729 domain-containing protein n=1 Tax=Amanita thiersii Skay4041 TaxID=703135 RepID=A0A2A9NM99_9AGAR|nr:hypothetical protein AMATHDRAFT_64531 [Amanita thiersii Skay4041]